MQGVVEGGTSLRKSRSAPRPSSSLPSSPLLAPPESNSMRSPSRPDPADGAAVASGRGGGMVGGGDGGAPPLIGPP
eukprot:scaffold3201_cov39-Phaeocystis_antarctica.AAC.1